MTYNFLMEILMGLEEAEFTRILVYMLIICICLITLNVIYIGYRQKRIRKKIYGLANNSLEMTPSEFISMRKESFGGRGRPSYANKYNFEGVYILYNKTKNLYYVGQGKQVLNRVNAHFTGKGNGDVYADYKYGDSFTIKMISLEKSGFSTLNALERNTIRAYNSFAKGYNKTRGNRG